MARTLRPGAGLSAAFSTFQGKALRAQYGFQMTGYKPVLQTVAASTTLVNDADLYLELMPGVHRLMLNLSTPSMTAAGGLKLQLVSESGLAVSAIALSAYFWLTAVAPDVAPITALSSAVNGGTTNAWTSVTVAGAVAVTQQGIIRLQWAQQAASGSTTLGALSTIESKQIT